MMCHDKPVFSFSTPILILALFASLWLGGCRKKVDPASVQPSTSGTGTIVPATLFRAEDEFSRRELEAAALSYLAALKSFGPDSFGSIELLHAALVVGLPSRSGDRHHARALLAQLVANPDPAWSESARLLVSWLDEQERLESALKSKAEEVEALAKELEKLKAIDLRRRPGRPPS